MSVSQTNSGKRWKKLTTCFAKGIFKGLDTYTNEILIEKLIVKKDIQRGTFQRKIEIFLQLSGFPFIAQIVGYYINGPKPNDSQSRERCNYILHRDIKLDNILLTRAKEGQFNDQIIAKLADMRCAVMKFAIPAFNDQPKRSIEIYIEVGSS
ncbi:hypothetical protein B0J11DRAFT_583116 [Dendryphion nanum]|uniref:Protein kinase domain-containing protein n=1 Tax=Dendryphion nanum TaxID=256645 RepID=A0A9P9IF73_9PLEO|nr:hypothetical protein B0J11DRAFT_583116 [Dendryphion nanum]